MRKLRAILISLIFILFFINNVTFFTVENKRETVTIHRIIDGDTVELTDGRIIRLANINSPEKNSPLSKLAINYLKKYENQSVEIEIIEEDQYNRLVTRVFTPTYLNEELVQLGFASKAWVLDNEVKDFSKLENLAVNEGRGIWTHSAYWNCFDISVKAEEEIVLIENNCDVSLNGFYIKDESRKIYKFLNIQSDTIELHTSYGQDTTNVVYWNSGNIWNNDRDTAYLFDKEDKIASYYSYGY